MVIYKETRAPISVGQNLYGFDNFILSHIKNRREGAKKPGGGKWQSYGIQGR